MVLASVVKQYCGFCFFFANQITGLVLIKRDLRVISGQSTLPYPLEEILVVQYQAAQV